jgi:hypothetical protein
VPAVPHVVQAHLRPVVARALRSREGRPPWRFQGFLA